MTFKKGNTPWNKGKKIIYIQPYMVKYLSKKTYFVAGYYKAIKVKS